MNKIKIILKSAFIIIWTLYCIIGVLTNMSHYRIIDWLIIIPFISAPYIIYFIIHHTKKKRCTDNLSQIDIFVENNEIQELSNIETNDSYVQVDNVIYRADNKPITDDEIPYVVQIGYEEALKREKESSNPKSCRTEKEEELCMQFIIKHENDIQKHTTSFEDACRLAYAEKDLNKKIVLLQSVIDLYEREKKWFYRTKGGTIYFQDFYEHLHNSNNEDFSYIDSVKNYLEYNIHKRDCIIPEIIQLVTSMNGIMQKDIYLHFPDEAKSDIQKIIRELESDNIISRTKKGNSYFLTLKRQ